MNNFLIALLIGFVAGTIDIMPMIVRKLDKTSCISAFVHYLALGLIIPFVNVDICPWLKGSLIALLTALPIMILVYPKDKKALIPMIIFSLILGAAIGQAGALFIQ